MSTSELTSDPSILSKREHEKRILSNEKWPCWVEGSVYIFGGSKSSNRDGADSSIVLHIPTRRRVYEKVDFDVKTEYFCLLALMERSY